MNLKVEAAAAQEILDAYAVLVHLLETVWDESQRGDCGPHILFTESVVTPTTLPPLQFWLTFTYAGGEAAKMVPKLRHRRKSATHVEVA